MSSTESKLALGKSVLSTIGSVAAAAVVARSFVPPEMQDYLFSGIHSFLNRFSNQLTMVIYEVEGFLNNDIYEAAQLYLSSKISPTTHRVKIAKSRNEKHIDVSLEPGEEIFDAFKGVNFKWVLLSKKSAPREYYNNEDMTSTTRLDMKYLELSFHRKHREFAMKHYLPFMLNEAKEMKKQDKSVKLFTVGGEEGYPTTWTPVNLDHPSTFETLAMDVDIKENVLNDLKRFVSRKEYYRKVGKAWKRGYLLYGPPGTGKSSLIAAMVNYLNFDIYDLELTAVRNNSELRRLLVATGNRSILVVEDIDCSAELHDRLTAEAPEPEREGSKFHRDQNKVTLSGFLNFIDGLWSSCGDERIIIFTTNHKDKMDPALLRPGRMDVHILMSYCTPGGFRVLAKNYLGTKHHELFGEIEDLIRVTEVTPAEVAEQLLKNEEPDVAFGGLVHFLHLKRKEAKSMKEEEASAEEKVEKAAIIKAGLDAKKQLTEMAENYAMNCAIENEE